MYPNLEAEAATKDAHGAVMETLLEFNSINYKESAKYIAANMTEKAVEESDLARVPTGRGKDQHVGVLRLRELRRMETTCGPARR